MKYAATSSNPSIDPLAQNVHVGKSTDHIHRVK